MAGFAFSPSKMKIYYLHLLFYINLVLMTRLDISIFHLNLNEKIINYRINS